MDNPSTSYAAIGAAYAARKDKTDEEIFNFLEKLKSKISGLGEPSAEMPSEESGEAQASSSTRTTQIPAVDPKASVTKDKIFCLECGQGFAMIKRHLNAAHNLKPEEYRAKWGLEPDYPMTSAKFSKKKQFAAKQIGFGTYDRKETKKKSPAKA